ncbi:MAG: Maf family nucleotide pyrophosphatase [Micrococcales bacterium]|nr:Maf family nucleotide pyrophosphatase [Micrococcales bacterium]
MPPHSPASAADVTLVLASASPARLATLRAAGIDPAVIVSDIDEDLVVADSLDRYGRLGPADIVLLLARAKCEEVASRTALSAVVIGCDSLLEIGGQVHGRPADAAEAVARWRWMRGRSGVLHTGHWVRDERDVDDGGGGGTLGATASTTVHFAEISDEEVERYVATGEPLRVAGAFTIDGLGGAFVTAIKGDHHTVVGLSLPLLRELLGELGIDWFDVASARGH